GRRSARSFEGRWTMQSQALVIPPKNRTNVRFLPASWKVASVRALGRVSTVLAARWLDSMFQTPPPPRKVRAQDRALFESGNSFSVVSEGDRLRGTFWGQGPSV